MIFVSMLMSFYDDVFRLPNGVRYWLAGETRENHFNGTGLS